MILEFDNNPNMTPEQLVRSLMENVQLALNEQNTTSEGLYRSLLAALGVEVNSIRSDFTSITERIEAEAQALTEAVSGALERLSAVEEIADKIDPILSDIENLKTRLTTAEANIVNLTAYYTALEARVAALENN